ncbi:hypothetical protein [Azospirillum agricola]|uniref:hypothetical protein n=1 Tax=Azospirillum agricola TaxID=1720247 RepID=UPI000A0F0A17|nr:hypothetical protein [Azospirillum agricola]MBP2229019.1 hypothetical protein [Azospirillum agricola]SMH62105.1 hypothetical protein SAMN02982994_6135 [Azospirillum lipoferum]
MFLVHPLLLLLWLLLSVLIGLLGRNKRFGFIGNFLVSFLFSPLVGIIVLLASDDRPRPAGRF